MRRPQTAVVLSAAAAIWWANRSAGRAEPASALLGLGLTLILGAGFIALQFLDWYAKPFSLATDAYSVAILRDHRSSPSPLGRRHYYGRSGPGVVLVGLFGAGPTCPADGHSAVLVL
ncbi:MAG: hypothetical protein JO110_30265, partial [Acetobacteraceae bacterium]|nr:hypothetical protein [Acetobacteraceae bacterium]